MNIARQYIMKIASIAMQICPKAHPIDSTMGIEALETSLITYVKLNSEAL